MTLKNKVIQVFGGLPCLICTSGGWEAVKLCFVFRRFEVHETRDHSNYEQAE